MIAFLITLAAFSVFFFFLLSKFRLFRSTTQSPLPPGPPGLPIIGNLHQLGVSALSADHLWHLSKRYGPLMSLRLGRVQNVFVSSAEMAKQVMKTNDLVFCTRPSLTGQMKFSYNGKDVTFSPYNEYWRQMRKIYTLHLLSSKQVNLFKPSREEEVFGMIDAIKSRIANKNNQVVNLSETMLNLARNIISRAAFGSIKCAYDDEEKVRQFHDMVLECEGLFVEFYYRDYFPFMGWVDRLNGTMDRLEKCFKKLDEFYQEVIDEHLKPNRPNEMQEDMVDILLRLKKDSDFSIDLTFDHIKAMLMNILFGGTDSSSSTVVWAMTLLMKNPESLKKLQQEIRDVVGDKGKVKEDDLQHLNYLKAVIKETFRLYPVVPLLLPHEARDGCVLDGYEIPKGTLVHVNQWAIGRDPKSWENPEEFKPERFMGSSIDYKGMNFELIPFGSGRRMCVGMLMGAVTVELALSNLVYSFDWELPDGKKDIDTSLTNGLVIHKKNDLRLVANVYDYGSIVN